MNFTFHSIEIDNFLSIGHACVNLEVPGFVRVSGRNNNASDMSLSNGAGKSSVFDAIVWALTGETLRGLTNNVTNIHGDDGVVVKLLFACDGNEYELVRSRGHSVLKTNLSFSVNGVDKSGKGIRDTEKIVEECFPDLTAMLVGSVIVLGQGLPYRFSDNTPSGRKEILERLSKSDFMIEDLKERISRRRDELTSLSRDNDSAITRTTTEISMLSSEIERKKESLSNVGNADELREKLSILTESKDGIEGGLRVAKESVTQKNDEVAKLRVEFSEMTNLCRLEQESSNKIVTEHINELALSMREKKALVAIKTGEVAKIENMGGICPTCGQPLSGSEKLSTEATKREIAEATALIEKMQKEYDESCAFRDDNAKRIEALYEQKKSDIVAHANEIKSAIDPLNTSIATNERALATINSEIASTQASIDFIEKSLKSTQKDIEKLESDKKEKEEKLGYYSSEGEKLKKKLEFFGFLWTTVTRDFRGYLLTNVISYIDSRAKEYSQRMFGGNSVEVSIDGNAICIKYDGRDYESLSGGERQKVDIIVQFALRDMLCKFLNFGSNILVVDEVFDNLDAVGSSNVISLITDLSSISTVYIITHHGDELSIPYDSELLVVKNTNGISEVHQK